MRFTEVFLVKIKELNELYKEVLYVDEIDIENRASGPDAIDVLRGEDDLPPIVAIEASRATGGKVARAQAIAPYIERGQVYINMDMPNYDVEQMSKSDNYTASELFVEQWRKFPFIKQDDLVDMTSQYLARAHKLMTGEDVKYERTIVKYTRWNAMMWSIYEKMSEEEQVKFIKDVGTPSEWAPDNDQ